MIVFKSVINGVFYKEVLIFILWVVYIFGCFVSFKGLFCNLRINEKIFIIRGFYVFKVLFIIMFDS